MMDTYPESTATPSVTGAEAHFWLLQEQHPERVLKQLSAWRLDATTDLSKLARAIENVIQAVPDLNARYRFSDEGDLAKSHIAGAQPCLQILHCPSREDAIERLLECQMTPWDAATQPPFQALIVHTAAEVLLGLVAHRVLAQTTDALFASIAASYDGAPLRLAPAAAATLYDNDVLRPAPINWARRPDAANWAIRSPWAAPANAIGAPLALPWQTTLDSHALDLDPAAASAVITARFAQFVTQLGELSTLALCIHHAGAVSQLQVGPCTVQQALIARLGEPLPPVTEADWSQPLAQLHVHWKVAGDTSAAASTLLAEALLLPSAEHRPDLELTVLALPDARLRLTLSTGQAIWAHMGEYLLGSFMTWLHGGAAPHPAMRSGCAASPAVVSDTAPPAERAAITATILAEFRAALEAPQLQADDDFFEYGGHSLLATRIIGKLLASHGLELGFSDFFSAPSAAALASRARRTGNDRQSTRVAMPANDPSSAPFALAQASLGRAYEAFAFGTLFNLPFAVCFLDRVDEALFEQAFSDLIRRHASLRSTFHFKEGEAWQQQAPIEQLSRYKWFWNSRESQGVTLASEATWQFDLTRELPLRVRFLTDPQSGRQTLSLLVHHMAIDEWSLNVMMQELALAYRARATDAAPQWSGPAPSFHEFATRQQAAGINRQHLDYWTAQLRDATRGLQLPGAVASTEAPSTQAQWLELVPEQHITDSLHAFARQQGSSLFSVVYTAIALALHKLGDLQDLVIGTSASGRTDPAFYDTVGYFTTMVAHRVQFDADQSVATLINDVTRTINDSMAYADVPLEQIQQALGMTPADGLLFDVYIQIHANNALNGALSAADGTPIRYRQIDPDKNESMFGLQFEIMDNLIDGQRLLRLVTTYRTERFSTAQVERISSAISAVFALIATPHTASRTLASIRL